VSASRWNDREIFLSDGFDCSEVAPFAILQLAMAGDGDLRAGACARLVSAASRLRERQARSPWGIPYFPTGGWDWGSNGRILNISIVLAAAYCVSRQQRFRDGALSSLDYLFGRNPVGLSFVKGYGTDYVRRQRVRHFAHAIDPSYPEAPPGSVCGGPASKDYNGFPKDPRFSGLPEQLCYVDAPDSEVTNDICIRWNASLVWMATWLLSELPGDHDSASAALSSG
jgi:endoglucanase